MAAAAVLAPVPPAAAVSRPSPERAVLPRPAATVSAGASGTSCAAADEQGFPLTTRIHDGPTSYEAGGGYGTWYLDLTNTTGRVCADVHPVVVLVDDKRVLKPSQAELEFYDGPRTRPVPLTETDESELVGVFDGDGFPGLTVAPGATVSVKVRLAVASDAVRNAVTANAAVVQRRGSDGDWVGESNGYRFGIGGEPPPASLAPAVPSVGAEIGPPTAGLTAPGSSGASSPGAGSDASPGATSDTGPGATSGVSPGATPAGTSAASPDGDPPFEAEAGEDREAGEDGEAGEAGEAAERARELAGTGLGAAHALLAAAVALLAAGGAGYALARGRR
ncbi:MULTISPECIES: hypothetical protein [unclassified Streptomyces]|uniref:hypothetical protein n=1 Tax=unclassified Streptomyces TaxID=2593676 RepID=UPI0037FCE16A